MQKSEKNLKTKSKKNKNYVTYFSDAKMYILTNEFFYVLSYCFLKNLVFTK